MVERKDMHQLMIVQDKDGKTPVQGFIGSQIKVNPDEAKAQLESQKAESTL